MERCVAWLSVNASRWDEGVGQELGFHRHLMRLGLHPSDDTPRLVSCFFEHFYPFVSSAGNVFEVSSVNRSLN